MSHVAAMTRYVCTMAKSKNTRPVRLAVLIDTSNVGSPDVLDFVFATIRHNCANAELTCHAFGDFLKHQEWKEPCEKYSFRIHQHNEGRYGKNSADIAMVILAMDIAYGFGRRSGKLVDGFCLVSSDTDFRALVLRLRSSGYKVYGFGHSDTADRLRNVFTDGFFAFPDPVPPGIEFTPCPAPEATAKVRNPSAPQPARVGSRPRSALERADDFLAKVGEKARPRTLEKLKASLATHFKKDNLERVEIDDIVCVLEKKGLQDVSGRLFYPGENALASIPETPSTVAPAVVSSVRNRTAAALSQPAVAEEKVAAAPPKPSDAERATTPTPATTSDAERLAERFLRHRPSSLSLPYLELRAEIALFFQDDKLTVHDIDEIAATVRGGYRTDRSRRTGRRIGCLVFVLFALAFAALAVLHVRGVIDIASWLSP